MLQRGQVTCQGHTAGKRQSQGWSVLPAPISDLLHYCPGVEGQQVLEGAGIWG